MNSEKGEASSRGEVGMDIEIVEFQTFRLAIRLVGKATPGQLSFSFLFFLRSSCRRTEAKSSGNDIVGTATNNLVALPGYLRVVQSANPRGPSEAFPLVGTRHRDSGCHICASAAAVTTKSRLTWPHIRSTSALIMATTTVCSLLTRNAYLSISTSRYDRSVELVQGSGSQLDGLFLGFPARRCSAAPARWETDRVSPHLLLPGTYPRARTLGGHVMLAHGRYFWRPDALSTMLCTAMMRVCSPPSLSPSHSNMAGSPFGSYSGLSHGDYVTSPFQGDRTDRTNGAYMTGPMYSDNNQFCINSASLQLGARPTPIITTSAVDDFDDSCWPSSLSEVENRYSPYGVQPHDQSPYSSIPGYRGLSDPILSDPESPHSPAGSDSFGVSSVNISPVDCNGSLSPSSYIRPARPRASSDTGRGRGHVLGAHSVDDTLLAAQPSNGLLSPPAYPTHRRGGSDSLINPHFFTQHPGGTDMLYGEDPAHSQHHDFGSYRGRPLSRASTVSSRSSRRPSPYTSVTSSPVGGNSDTDLPPALGQMELKAEDSEGGRLTQGIAVARPNVTSPAIKQASEVRRIKPAPHKCAVCGSTFTRKANLDGHLTAHKGEKPYPCDVGTCSKAFARLNDLKRHKKIHEKEGHPAPAC